MEESINVREYVKEVEQPQVGSPSGKTPILITGGTNNITIVENQYNERSAADTVKGMLEKDKISAEMMSDIVKMAMSSIAPIFAKMAERKAEQPKPTPTPPTPKKKKATTKKTK